MGKVNVFIDSSVANRIAELDDTVAARLNGLQTSQPEYIEDKSYLAKIVDNFVLKGIVEFYWNASVKAEIAKTRDWKRNRILSSVKDCRFSDYHSTVFPILLSDENPATFLTTEQKQVLDNVYAALPRKFRKDIKILADSLFNREIEFLLTTDRKHLANDRLRKLLESKELQAFLRVRTPKELFNELNARRFEVA